MVKIVSTFLLTFLFSVNFLFSQLYTSGMYSPQNLCTDILSWPGVDVVSVNYTGAQQAIGYFDSYNANVGITEGLIMTTGTIYNTSNGPHGPNNQTNAGFDNGRPGYELLTNLAGNTTYNAVVLEIDFIAQASEIELTYVFGSDEYPEYVCTPYNDVFGIFIVGGAEYPNPTLLSKIPGKNIPVIINAVNSGTTGTTASSNPQNCANIDPNWQDNSVYYVHNGNGNQSPYNSSDEYIQYDGMTVPLTAIANLEIGVQYKLTIAIADVGDGIYDSGLFIQANTISTVGVSELNTAEKIVVYPNPNDGQFKVVLVDKGLSNYKITDSSGRTIKAGEIMINDSELNFHLTDKGVYILQLFNDGEIFTERIVIH